MAEEPTVRPFSCGTQYGDWTAGNCATCKKAAPEGAYADQITCEIEYALSLAYILDGRIPLAIAERSGQTRYVGCYGWPCKEHDPPWADWNTEPPKGAQPCQPA